MISAYGLPRRYAFAASAVCSAAGVRYRRRGLRSTTCWCRPRTLGRSRGFRLFKPQRASNVVAAVEQELFGHRQNPQSPLPRGRACAARERDLRRSRARQRTGRDQGLQRGRRAERQVLPQRAGEGARSAAVGPRRVHRLPGGDPRRAARLGRKGKGGPGVGSNVDTASPPSADEQRELNEAANSADPVRVGGQHVTPGFRAAGVGGDLPPLVLAVLLALFAAMATGGALALSGTGPASRPPGRWASPSAGSRTR